MSGISMNDFYFTLLLIYNNLKEQVNRKWKLCHHLLTFMSFQTFLTFVLLWNIKICTLKNT